MPACLPVGLDAAGEPCLARQPRDGRRALRLKGDAQTNLLTRALADDPHFGPYMAIPGKDNGLDIEGLAVDGRRLLLGLRGPVLRGWSALLEIAVEASGGQLRLAPLDDSGTLIRKHFLQLDGLGVRDLHFSGDDLYILAGPTMVLNGDIRVFKWPAAKPALAANREPVRFEAALTESISLPHGRGSNRAEAICDQKAFWICSTPWMPAGSQVLNMVSGSMAFMFAIMRSCISRISASCMGFTSGRPKKASSILKARRRDTVDPKVTLKLCRYSRARST